MRWLFSVERDVHDGVVFAEQVERTDDDFGVGVHIGRLL